MWSRWYTYWAGGAALATVLGAGCTQQTTAPGAAPPATASAPTPSAALAYVVDPLTLANRPGNPATSIILDVRPRPHYDAGHFKTARWLDLVGWTAAAKSPENGLDDIAYWRRQALRAGIAGNEMVHVYDGGEMTEAARVWFILQLIGVQYADVVDGGWPRLAEAAGPGQIDSAPPSPPPGDLEFVGQAPPIVGLVERGGLQYDLKHQQPLQLLDVRTTPEFTGAEPRGNPRAGHLPGAHSLPHQQLLQKDGRLKPAAELWRIFTAAGLKPGQLVVVHCQSGGRASLGALAIAGSGFAPVENYYLSFGDWAKDESCPVEK